MTGRDPVDVAELERDYDETYGNAYTRSQEKQEYEANKADMEYGDVDDM